MKFTLRDTYSKTVIFPIERDTPEDALVYAKEIMGLYWSNGKYEIQHEPSDVTEEALNLGKSLGYDTYHTEMIIKAVAKECSQYLIGGYNTDVMVISTYYVAAQEDVDHENLGPHDEEVLIEATARAIRELFYFLGSPDLRN